MAQDIFDFWAECPPEARVHPQDEPVFRRPFVGNMGFDLDCLPCNFWGPLRTAPVILLYLSPGIAHEDLSYAASAKGRADYAERRRGFRPLELEDDVPARKWWTSRAKPFGISLDDIRHKLAILNLGAYHSQSFNSVHALAALPSSRVALDWAHEVLFPQAMKGERVVVCMRAAEHWGLKPGERHGTALYAPKTVRSGHMRGKDEHAVLKNEIVAAVRHKLGAD